MKATARHLNERRDEARRKFGYRCGFCGVAETLLGGDGPWEAFVVSHYVDGDQIIYTCRRCDMSSGLSPRRGVFEHRAEKSYFRHLRFEPDGTIRSLTPHGEKVVWTLDLNDAAKVRLRKYEWELRHELAGFLQSAGPLVTKILSTKPGEIGEQSEIERFRSLVLEAQKRWEGLPEPIDRVYSTEQLLEFDALGAERHLTPYLIRHLKRQPEDLQQIHPEVFESLVAEFFAGQGFNVHLVGRNIRTGADIFALRKLDPFGIEVRYMIEVKRWRRRVGIEEIRKVAGVLNLERHKYGWHLAVLVSLAGFKDIRSTRRDELSMLGIELRGKESLIENLQSYKPRTDGGLRLTYGWDDSVAGARIR